MLSICIPVYNFDITRLVKDLHRQALELDKAIEILLLDDGSSEDFKIRNRVLKKLPLVRYEELPENTGRSKIRNLLAAMARYPHLIFMDCDSAVPDNHYLGRYLDVAPENPVVCGGRSYQPDPPNDNTYLRWLFGVNREVKSAAERSKNPNHSFMTNNFLISKELVKKFPFNENLKGYGHEDTLFGFELKKNGIAIHHIENPLLHIGLETAEEFLRKTREGIKNLVKIYHMMDKDPELSNMVRVLKTYENLRRFYFYRVYGLIFNLMEKPIVKHLNEPPSRLFFFDLYKLGIICRQASIR